MAECEIKIVYLLRSEPVIKPLVVRHLLHANHDSKD